jgi:type IV secretion system protein VirB10
MPAVSGPDSAALAAGTGTRLARGTLLPAVLMTEVRSDLPGTLVAQVTQTVWDTVSGDRMLVPQGARLIGEYGSDLRPGRERLLAVFTRLLWPDGRVLDIGRLSAVDALGRSGLADQVDTRFAERFGAGFMVAGLASLLAPRERQPATVLVVPVGAGAVSGLGAAAGTVLVETTRAILEQQRQAPPVVIVRQGHRFNVIVQEDLTVPADPRAGAAGVRAPEDAHAAARR